MDAAPRFRWLIAVLVLALVGILASGLRCNDEWACRSQTAAALMLGSGATLLAFALSIWQLSASAISVIADAGGRGTAGLRALVPWGIVLVLSGAGWLVTMSERSGSTLLGVLLLAVAVLFIALGIAVACVGRPSALTLPALRPNRNP